MDDTQESVTTGSPVVWAQDIAVLLYSGRSHWLSVNHKRRTVISLTISGRDTLPVQKEFPPNCKICNNRDVEQCLGVVSGMSDGGVTRRCSDSYLGTLGY